MRERSTLPPLPANIDPDPAEEHIERLEAECDRYRAKSERRNTLYMEQRARAISADAEADWEALQEVNIRLAREVLKAEAVVDKALNVSDSNYRRLEDSLRKSGWIAGADEVQVLRKVLAAIHTDRDEAW